MLVSFDRNLCYLRSSKTAGTSTEIAIAQTVFPGQAEDGNGFDVFSDGFRTATGKGKNQARAPMARLSILLTKKGLGPRSIVRVSKLKVHSAPDSVERALSHRWEGLTKAVNVRNPYDLMVSRYFWHNPGASPDEFEAWLMAKAPEPRFNRVLSQYFGSRNWVFLRFEELPSSLNDLGRGLGLSFPKLQNFKSSTRPENSRRNVRILYSKKSAEVVKREYADWIDFFGYEY